MSTSRPRLGLVIALLVVLTSTAVAAQAQDPPQAVAPADPTVTAPLPSSAVGAEDRNYPFAAADPRDLAAHGYTETERFFSGVTAGGPYTSRMIVRRPSNGKKFSGVVWVEWLNVTEGYDLDILWSRSARHLMDRGDAYVAVDAQTVGVLPPLGLKGWNPSRYASINIPTSGYFVAETGGFEIYAQALQAIRHPAGEAPLDGLKVKTLVAHGYSQSAGTVSLYSGLGLGTLHGLADAYLIGGLSTSTIGYGGQTGAAFPYPQSLTGVPVLLLQTESDYSRLKTQPENPWLRIWEVAGASHADLTTKQYFDATYARDWGEPPVPYGCLLPDSSRVHFAYVQNAAMDALVRWAQRGTAPAQQPYITTDRNGDVVRDAAGNALGGIRLPDHAVPTAVNSRENSGTNDNCMFVGSYRPFSPSELKALYPTHQAYVDKVRAAARRSVAAGVLLPDDAAALVRAADEAPVPS